MDHCNDCGYDYCDHLGPAALSDLRSLGPRFGSRLTDNPADVLRTRPKAGVWCPLEYACHVRDVLLTQRERLFLAMVEDRPGFAPMYREQRVELADYANQEPTRLAHQLTMAAELLTDGFGHLEESDWQRQCTYNYPTPTLRSLAWLAAHTLHEGEHHLGDIDRTLEAMR